MLANRASLLAIFLCFFVAMRMSAEEEDLPAPIREMTILGLDKSVPHMPLTYGHVMEEIWDAYIMPFKRLFLGRERFDEWLRKLNAQKRDHYMEAFNKYQRELKQFYTTPRGRKMLVEIRRQRGE